MRRKLAIVDPNDFWPDRVMDRFFDNSSLNEWDDTELEMYEDNNNVVVTVKAPGFNQENVELTLEDNVLTVSGKVKSEEQKEDDEKKTYYQRMSHQSFTRSVRLPVRVKADDAEAEFKDGMVKVTMPKAEEAKPQKVKIKMN